MKKRFLVLSLALVLSLPALYADIGENFAKGGIGLSGSVSYFNNLFYFMDDTDQRKFWSVDVSPGIEFFVANKTSVTFAPWLYYESAADDPDNIYRYMNYGLRVGASHVFLADPAAQRGLVFSIGGSIGLGLYPTLDDLIAGVETPNNYSRVDILLYFTPRLYYFLNDRLAPFIGITPHVGYILSYKDPGGTKVDLTSQESIRATLTATVGISWFIPSKNASLSAPRRVR